MLRKSIYQIPVPVFSFSGIRIHSRHANIRKQLFDFCLNLLCAQSHGFGVSSSACYAMGMAQYMVATIMTFEFFVLLVVGQTHIATGTLGYMPTSGTVDK